MARRPGQPTKSNVRKAGHEVIMGQPTKYRDEFPEMLIEHMKQGKSFPTFAAVIGTGISILYEWCDPKKDEKGKITNPIFHREFLEAKEKGTALLMAFDEDTGRVGIRGQLKRVSAVHKKTKKDGTVEEKQEYAPAQFAQSAWIFQMKNRYPQHYRDRIENVQVDAEGKPVDPVQVVINLAKEDD